MNNIIYISYPSLISATGYIQPEVKLEFSPCASREQSLAIPVKCELAPYAGTLALPSATPQMMLAERTFWEKVEAIHAFCKRGTIHRGGFARHAYDLAQLETAGVAGKAVADKSLVEAVAKHMALFYRPQKDRDGRPIDFLETVKIGGLELVPCGQALKALENDYREMVDSGMIYGSAKPFDELMEICAKIERLVNDGPTPDSISGFDLDSD